MTTVVRESDVVRPSKNHEPWRVLVVDGHPLYRDALRALLGKELGLVISGEADTEETALHHILTVKPDLVTVDVQLAHGNGLSLITRLKHKASPPRVLVISAFQDGAYADLALDAGAAGYVSKYTDRGELKLALETIRDGKTYISADIHRGMLLATRTRRSTDRVGKKQLSSRELQIFTMVGTGRNTPEIAAELGLAVSTVETYRERLKTKLNLASGSELAKYAFFCAMQTVTPVQ
jgi:DNA-binding NarL/FixJ family response regulator